MEKSQKQNKIIHLTTVDLSGAGRAAMRIVEAECHAGLQALLLCLFQKANATTAHVAQYVPRSTSLWRRCLQWLHLYTTYYKYITKRLNAYKVVDGVAVLHSDCLVEKDKRVQDSDIIHLHWVRDLVDLGRLLRRTKQPIVWTLHDQGAYTGCCCYASECKRYMHNCGCCPALSSLEDADYSRELWQEKWDWYHRYADRLHIVCPSNWMAMGAKQSSLMQHLDIRVIPNCIDTHVFVPPVLYNETTKLHLLFGAMNAKDIHKGYLRLVNVLERMKQHPAFLHYEIEILLLGENSKDIESLPYPVRQLGFVNNDTMLVEVYQQATLLLYASYRDNLPNMIMESMACGTPVVAFHVGGIGDMIDHQHNGYLATSQDDFVEGVAWCIAHRAELSRAAREKVLRCFSMDVVAQQYTQCYEEVLNGK